MNKLTIIGNMTADPQTRTVNTANGTANVCDFTVAENSRKGDANFFHVTAWRGLADVIGKYGAKGKKVCVVGPVTLRTYQGKDGKTHASLEVTADDFEFCERREAPQEPTQEPAQTDKASGMPVINDPDLPI